MSAAGGRVRAVAVLTLLWAVVVLPAVAQDLRGRRRASIEEMGDVAYSGRLTFARIRFEQRDVWRGGYTRGMPPWAHDYPYAERNFMKLLSEISTARTFVGGSRILALDDPELFRFPIAYLCEPGHWSPSEEESAALRAYLRKGGFIIFDDFSGGDWTNFAAAMDRVLPGVRFAPMSVDHPVFQTFFEVERLELRHPNYRGYTAEFLGIYEDNDPSKRLLAIINYNTDIGDYFEYSATGWVPLDLTNDAYKLGVNYWMYALTH